MCKGLRARDKGGGQRWNQWHTSDRCFRGTTEIPLAMMLAGVVGNEQILFPEENPLENHLMID